MGAFICWWIQLSPTTGENWWFWHYEPDNNEVLVSNIDAEKERSWSGVNCKSYAAVRVGKWRLRLKLTEKKHFSILTESTSRSSLFKFQVHNIVSQVHRSVSVFVKGGEGDREAQTYCLPSSLSFLLAFSLWPSRLQNINYICEMHPLRTPPPASHSPSAPILPGS